MPPKKDKKDAGVTGEQAHELILDYLVQQNRPYSVIEINANLHNAVTKATATKVLKELHDSGKIEGRASGKQVVYHAIQDPAQNASEEDLKALDNEAEGLRERINTLKAKFKGQQSNLMGLSSLPSVDALRETIAVLEEEVAGMRSRVSAHHEECQELVDPAKTRVLEAEYALAEKVYLLRKKQVKDLWDTVTEAYDGDRTELWETLGLDGEM